MSSEARHYIGVYLALMALLGLTLGAAYLKLGTANTVIALLIAITKALLIGIYFMHLKKSSGLARVFSVVGVFWLMILLSLAISDYMTRGWLESPGPWPQPGATRNL